MRGKPPIFVSVCGKNALAGKTTDHCFGEAVILFFGGWYLRITNWLQPPEYKNYLTILC